MATANTEFTRLDSVEKEKIEAILEAPNLPSVSSTDNGKILKVANGKWAKGNETVELPSVTGTDNGKILKVSNGEWSKESETVELPAVTADDNGKVLMVVEGVWAVASLPSSNPTPDLEEEPPVEEAGE